MNFNKKVKVVHLAFAKNANKMFRNMENPLPASIVTLLRHLSMENVIDVMIVTDVMDLPKPVNSVSKNVLLTKRTRMENYSVGYVPCLIKELWFAPNNRIPHDIVEFSNLKKTKKKKKKGIQTK